MPKEYADRQMTNSSEIISNLMEWLVLRYGTKSEIYKLYKPNKSEEGLKFKIVKNRV
jgi:hypothetical protein